VCDQCLLYEAPTAAEVERSVDAAGLDCARIVEAVAPQ
jgi:hypothetical protein